MKTVSIRIVPITTQIVDGKIKVTVQEDGPTEKTTNWSVYERYENRSVSWFADTISEQNATWIGCKLALRFGVPVEHQAWKPPVG